MDKEKEAGVWQRVAAPPQGAGAPEWLLQEAGLLAGIYRSLAGRLTGREQQLARKLAEEEQTNAACLRGILFLSGTPAERMKHWEPRRENPGNILKSCYYRTRRCLAEYAARSLDPEFGEVYRELAQRAGEQCVRIAELLGILK